MAYTVDKYFNQLPFKSIKDYGKIKDQLGKGAYGVVYKYQKEDGTEYAVKKMATEEDLSSVVIRELSVMTLLRHPNIVKIIDISIDAEGTAFVVMELAEGDLNSYLATKKLDQEQIKLLFYQLIKAMEYMHSLAIWHRDIKPDNILVFPDGTVKIADLGLARFGAIPNNLYTVPVGTLWWRPPDLLLGAKSYGPETDVWSLGIILGQMGYGECIISGDNEKDTLIQIVKKIGGMTEAQWPGISGMTEFNTIRKINEEHPTGSIFSDPGLNEKLGPDGVDLLKRMLTSNPSKRITMKEAAAHPYFNSVRNNFNYPLIPDMVCGDRRVLMDIRATAYKRDISDNTFQILMNWLNEVTSGFKFSPATLYRARYIMDQYLSATDSKFSRGKIQLLGTVAMMIGAKIEEIYPPWINDYIYISAEQYSVEEIVKLERDIVKTLRFQLAYPIISEYIKYYNEGLPKSILTDANILGKALMVSPNIPNIYQAHKIAKALVYIASNKSKTAVCLEGVDINLAYSIVEELERLIRMFPILIHHPTEDVRLKEILEKFKKPVSLPSLGSSPTKSEPPKTIYKESPKLSGERVLKRVKIRFDGASDEDIDRIDVIKFLFEYIISQALLYVNSFRSSAYSGLREKFADYFGFVPTVMGKYGYIQSKKELQRITYNLGKLTVETNATINFNYVLPVLVPAFKRFVNTKLVDGTEFANSKLSGKLFAV